MIKPFSALSVASAVSQQNPALVASAGELTKGSQKQKVAESAEGSLEDGFRSLVERKVEEPQAVKQISFEELVDLLYSDPDKLIHGNLQFGGPFDDSVTLSTLIIRG